MKARLFVVGNVSQGDHGRRIEQRSKHGGVGP